MMDTGYVVDIEVPETPVAVFNCLKEVSKWWSKDYSGSNAKLNDEFIINHSDLHYSKQKLVELIPGQKMVWLVTESKLYWLKKDPSEWTDTKMIFELTPQGDKTLIHFTHEGLRPEKECYAMCTGGWDMVIKDRLFNYITKKIDI